MTFWILAGAIGIIVALVIWLAALRGARNGAASSAAQDLEIYRDQLRELERDAERGVIGPEEAARARTEVSRRVLEADRRLQEDVAGAEGSLLPVGIALVVTIAIAVVTYFTIGAPGYPDLPLEERIARIEEERAARPSQAEAEAQAPDLPAAELSEEDAAALQALRARLSEGSDDPQAWRALVEAEANQRNYRAAKTAQEQLLALLGDGSRASQWVDLARLRILAAGGYISPEAETALLTALSLDPTHPDARFLLGAMYNGQGRPDLTYPLWMGVLQSEPPGSPVTQLILREIEVIAFFAGERFDPAALPQAPGPSQSDIDAAAQLSPEEQMAMVEDMVARLNDRLANEGGTEADWARLITSYGILGRFDAAENILAEAREVFAGNANAMALFDQAEALLTEAQQ